MAETTLELAERHVREQEQRISAQHNRIQRLSDAGLPVDLACDTLAVMQETLKTLRMDAERLSHYRARQLQP